MTEIKTWRCDICSALSNIEPFRGFTEVVPTVNRPIWFTLSIEHGDFCRHEITRYLPEFIEALKKEFRIVEE